MIHPLARYGVQLLVSGGQTGADRAALDWARRHEVPHGGWCPLGRAAEDGTLDAAYRLVETPGAEPSERTLWNVRDSEATTIFACRLPLSGGSSYTLSCAEELDRPTLVLIAERDGAGAADRLRAFLELHRPRRWNVAGPRASQEAEVAAFVTGTLEKLRAVAQGAVRNPIRRRRPSRGASSLGG